MSIDHILAQIRKQGTARTPRLALFAEMGESTLDALLTPLCAPGGPLLSCDVEVAGRRVKEYRVSLVGGAALRDDAFVGAGRPRKPVERAAVSTGFGRGVTKALNERFQKPAAPHLNHVPPSRHTASRSERIRQVVEQHGPMTVKDLRSRGLNGNVGVLVASMIHRGQLVRLGGGNRSTIYGLPAQRAEPGPSADGEPLLGEIEKNVPIPPPVKPANVRLRQRLAALKAGDSFVTEYSRFAVRDNAKSIGKFITRKESESLIRVWRIS